MADILYFIPRPRRQAVCSFLIIRLGSDDDSSAPGQIILNPAIIASPIVFSLYFPGVNDDQRRSVDAFADI